MKKVVVLGVFLSVCIYGMDVDTQPYNNVYTEFQQALKPLWRDNVVYMWRRAKEILAWKIAQLESGAFLIGEYTSGALYRLPTDSFGDFFHAYTTGWIVTVCSENQNNLSLPSYEECAKILNLQENIQIHPATWLFLKDVKTGEESAFGQQAGRFFWKVHNTIPVCTISLLDDKRGENKCHPNRILNTIYQLSNSISKRELAQVGHAFHAHHHAQPLLTRNEMDALKAKIVATIPEAERTAVRMVSTIRGCFLVLRPARTHAGIRGPEVDGYYVTAYSDDKDNLMLPCQETCKELFTCDAVYLAPEIAQIWNGYSSWKLEKLADAAKIKHDATYDLYYKKHV